VDSFNLRDTETESPAIPQRSEQDSQQASLTQEEVQRRKEKICNLLLMLTMSIQMSKRQADLEVSEV